jgi:hypothetical protein
MTTRPLWRASLLGATLGLTSCTGVEPALIGAAVSGAQTGVTLLSGAEVWTYEIADFDSVVNAIGHAETELGLRQLNEMVEEDRYWVYFRFARTARLIVEVRRQTPTVTSIEVEVADKDQQGMASLFLKRVIDRIEKPSRP